VKVCLVPDIVMVGMFVTQCNRSVEPNKV